MSKGISEQHDSFGGSAMTPEEAITVLGEEGKALLEAYKNDPNPSTYKGYRVLQAKFKALVTGENYIEPVKYHDLAMADIYTMRDLGKHMDFFVGVLGRFKRKCLWSIPTMQVGVDKGSYYFGYHPEFYKYYPLKFTVWALQHEAHHILQEHIPRAMKLYSAMIPKDTQKPTRREIEKIQRMTTFSNIAADEAVNSILDHNAAFNDLDRSDFIHPDDYGHDKLLSYEQYLNIWMLNAYSLFQKKQDGSGMTGMGSGHQSMEDAMQKGGKGEKGEGEGQGQGQGSGGGDSLEDQLQKDFNDVTGSKGHTWIDDVMSGKSRVPKESAQDKIERMKKEAEERGIEFDPEAALQEIKSQKGEEGESSDGQGGKSGDGEGDGNELTAAEVNDLADSLSKQSQRALREEVQSQISRKGRGTVPGNYLEKFDELTAEYEMHWTEQFEMMISDPKEAKETYRINKYNRNNMMLPSCSKYGFKEDDPKYHIWVSVDSSGSMNRDDILEGFSVVQSIQKSDSEILVTFCEFDTKVQNVRELESDDEIDPVIYGRGGTDFDVVFEYIDALPEDKQPDLHVIFTDGGAPPPSHSVRIPTNKMPLLWVLTSSQYSPWFMDVNDPYGEVLKTNNAK